MTTKLQELGLLGRVCVVSEGRGVEDEEYSAMFLMARFSFAEPGMTSSLRIQKV
jgi:hypothetical protein